MFLEVCPGKTHSTVDKHAKSLVLTHPYAWLIVALIISVLEKIKLKTIRKIGAIL